VDFNGVHRLLQTRQRRGHGNGAPPISRRRASKPESAEEQHRAETIAGRPVGGKCFLSRPAEEHGKYVIVEKFGVAGGIAEEEDPRK
jgi:hypothetical protein